MSPEHLRRMDHLIRSAILSWKKAGFVRTAVRVRDFILKRTGASHQEIYTTWIRSFEAPRKKREYGTIEEKIRNFRYHPRISFLMPVFDSDEIFLRKAIFSVIYQYYQDWELCCIDDGSSKRIVRKILSEFTARDSRIKVTFLDKNEGIASATNKAAGLATGEFLAFLDHDDELEPEALYENVKLLNEDGTIDLIYSDNDSIDKNGSRAAPRFKPGWSPVQLLSYCYVGHLKIVRKSLYGDLGGFRTGYDFASDYDFLLRVAEKTKRVAHIQKILYHKRSLLGQASRNPLSITRGKLAVEDALARRNIKGTVLQPVFAQKEGWGIYRIQFDALSYSEKVTIIMLVKNEIDSLKKTIISIRDKTRYGNYDVLVVNNSVDRQAHEFLNQEKIWHIDIHTEGLNISQLNNRAVKEVESELIVFLHSDVDIISPQWLLEMVGSISLDDNIGAIGAGLAHHRKRIDRSGVLWGYNLEYSTEIARDCAAVAGVCMLTRKGFFEKVGGFDEVNLPVSYSDLDYCLKLRAAGHTIAYNPYALLFHHDCTADFHGHDKRHVRYFKKKWETMDNAHAIKFESFARRCMI
jgi:O-antigen biosynthesis protein